MKLFTLVFWTTAGAGWESKAVDAAEIFAARGDWPQALWALALFCIGALHMIPICRAALRED